MSRRSSSAWAAQPPAEALARARKRSGRTQRELAACITARGVRCSAHTVERWETRSETRQRNVPAHIWPIVRDVLDVLDVAPESTIVTTPADTRRPTAPTAPTRPERRLASPAAPTVVPSRTVQPLLRPASPPYCLEGCCARFDCERCGAFAGVGLAEARLHVCRALRFLLDPSAALLAALAPADDVA